jgi:5-deoxy-D-glucuronate isomerase
MASKLLCRAAKPDTRGCIQRVTPQSAGWGYVGFEAYMLKAGDSLSQDTEGYHPVATVADYDNYYLNVRAGPLKQWKFTWEKDHEWINSATYPRGVKH